MENIIEVLRHKHSHLAGRTFRAVLAILLFLDFAFAGRPASCITSTDVHEGEATSIICNYHTNLRETKTGFYVYSYPFDGKDPDIPVVCDWEQDSLSCDVMPGYQAKLHNESVTLNILSVRENHAGTYSCKTFQPSEDLQVENCELTLQGQNAFLPHESEIYNNTSVYCHAKTHLLHGEPTSIVCFVHRSFNARSIILERHKLHGASEPEEIARCDKRKECRLNVYGYEINSREDDGLTAIVAMVDKAGTYVCTAEKDNQKAESCSLSFDAAALRDDRLSEKPTEDWFGFHRVITIGLFVIILFLLVAVSLLSWSHFRRSRGRTQGKHEKEEEKQKMLKTNKTIEL